MHTTVTSYHNTSPPPPNTWWITTCLLLIQGHCFLLPKALSFKPTHPLFSLRRSRVVSTNIVCSIAKMETTLSSHWTILVYLSIFYHIGTYSEFYIAASSPMAFIWSYFKGSPPPQKKKKKPPQTEEKCWHFCYIEIPSRQIQIIKR